MKYLFTIIQLFFICTGLISQSLEEIADSPDDSGWIKFQPDFKTSAQDVFITHKSSFGLASKDEMKLVRQETDNLGYTHFRFQQLYKGIEVEGGEYILHSKGNRVLKGNGKIIPGLDVITEPEINIDEAIDIAMRHKNARIYMWEDHESEQKLKSIKNDQAATYFPNPELVIVKSDNSKGNMPEYRLAFKVDINSKVPFDGNVIYIDVQNGKVLKELSLHINCTPGEGCTLYNGPSLQEIDTDPVGSEFRLFDDCRGDGIHTRRFVGSEEIYDDTNEWTDATQCAGVSVHWGLEKTYDYYLAAHDRNSYDNDGGIINAFIESNGKGLDNAFWDLSLKTLNFGEGGGGSTTGDLVSLDIVGHEFTHGVAQSAGLSLSGESGALNESFADIFGTAIEFFVLGDAANYLIAEDMWIDDGYLRNMMNPKAKASAPSPDTYLGDFWTGDDNHNDGGVQNFWFYLLAEGSASTDGINDNGEVYNITGIGLEKAAAIAYRNLTVYLTLYSDYHDARYGSIEAAIDSFGECSIEAMEVAAAWDAVGVYDNDNCQKYVTIPNLPISSDEYQAQNCISSTGNVASGSNVIMHAGKSVFLKPGFIADSGSEMYAYIEGCIPNGFNISALDHEPANNLHAADNKAKLLNQKDQITIKNFPNPFSETMTFEIELKKASVGKLDIFDLSGRLVSSVLNNEKLESGVHRFPFDGQYLRSGVYFYHFSTLHETIKGKMILAK